VFFVQIASHYAGSWLAKVLPAWQIRVPFTGYGFNLNPGPWSIKEHVLVTISAASGATSNQGATPIAMAQLYYGDKIPPAAALFFMWAIVYVGYSFAAVARQFLLYDPIYPWPQALMQTSLFETFRKADSNSKRARKQKYVFLGSLGAIILWQFLPEYVFPFLSSLSFLCWVASRNSTANFIGAGIGGMGFLNFSLDWANVSNTAFSNPMIAPFWTSAIIFVAYAFSCWVLLPAAKWGSLGSWKHHLMSNRLFLENGTAYPITALIGSNNSFNETAYQEYGPAYMGTLMLWTMFFDYASYTSAFVWMLLFGMPQIRSAISKLRARAKTRGAQSINYQYTDKLNVMQRAYKEVPLWWYLALFMASFISIIVILAKGYFFIPVWTFFIALLTGVAVVIPMGWLYALSNFQVAVGTTNELLYGYMVNTGEGHRHPAGASTYGSIAGDAWYRAQYMLQDQKIGHYMHIPPRAVFFSQIFGELIGIPINYGVVQWVLSAKGDYLRGDKKDPLGQWTGQMLASYNSLGVQYVVFGPSRLFKEYIFHPLPYGFLFGAGAPLIVYAFHRCLPRARFDLCNVTIFASAMSYFYGNLSTGFTSRLIVAYISMHYFYRYRFNVWKNYKYLVAAALDAGFNITMLLIFLFFSSGKVIAMPNWWGNNAASVERCFALDSN
jgi:OPT family oligopeptide transporter